MKWIKKNRKEFIVLFLILLVTLGLRIYKIDQYMTFLGDEGRDALMVRRILTTFDIPLLGPPTSIGNMYLGPLYYYMMAVSMAVVWLNPVAAAVMVALIGTGTVFLVYYLSREWFGRIPAVISAVLYSISSVNIIYSRSSWNPNPAPFFTLLAFLGFDRAKKTGNFIWITLTGVSVAFAVQMHYLALILIPVFVCLWGYELWQIKRKKLQSKYFYKGTIFAVLAFLFLMSPLVIFDLKHDFMNYKAISAFFGNRETTVNLNPLNGFERFLPIYYYNLIQRYITGDNIWLVWITSLSVISALVIQILKKKFSWPFFVLGSWLFLGVLGLTLYKQNIYDHYLGFLNPAPFLLFGGLYVQADFFKEKKLDKILKTFVLVIFAVLVFVNIQRSPFLTPPNRQLQKTQEVSKFIIEKSENKPFNFALLSEHNYDSAYQFYLDKYGNRPKEVPKEITDTLFVVCEDRVCEPINNPKYEIAAFGWGMIESEQEFDGVKVFKIIHKQK